MAGGGKPPGLGRQMTTERDDGDTAQRPGPLPGPGPHERSGLCHEFGEDQLTGSTKTCLATSTGSTNGPSTAAAVAPAVAAVATAAPPTAALTTAPVAAGGAAVMGTGGPAR